MGTLLLTLNKWEIMSGDLWGHYNKPYFGHNGDVAQLPLLPKTTVVGLGSESNKAAFFIPRVDPRSDHNLAILRNSAPKSASSTSQNSGGVECVEELSDEAQMLNHTRLVRRSGDAGWDGFW